MNVRCPHGSGKLTSLALSSFHPPDTSIAVDSQCVASAAIRLSHIKIFQQCPSQLCTTGFNTGAMTATIMLQEYAALTTLVAQQQDRDTL